MRVALIAKPGQRQTGVGRYVGELTRALRAGGDDVVEVSTAPGIPRWMGTAATRLAHRDLESFITTYPVKVGYPDADVYHFSSQSLTSLLLICPPRGHVVATVHDIIPYLVRHSRQLSSYSHPFHRIFDFLAMQGLKRADLLLADSAWTRDTLIQELRIAADRVRVVHLGVDTERFRPMEVPEEFRSRYGLDRRFRHLLYVGSEDPRKNLEALLRAFALLSRQRQDLRLLKVGHPHHLAEHRRLVTLAGELGIADEVIWVSQAPDDDLPLFYNAADMLVMPSLYEGFGLTVLEALACGTPVVSADTASLPEIAGYDSHLCAPTAAGVAGGIAGRLAQRDTAQDSQSRRRWALNFTWQRAAQLVHAEYCRAISVETRKR